MTDWIYVSPQYIRRENGEIQLWFITPDENGGIKMHRQITTLIDGEIVSESSEAIKEIVS